MEVINLFDSDDDFHSGCQNVSQFPTNNPSQDYTHPDNHTSPTYDMTTGFKPSTVHSMLDQAELKVEFNYSQFNFSFGHKKNGVVTVYMIKTKKPRSSVNSIIYSRCTHVHLAKQCKLS